MTITTSDSGELHAAPAPPDNLASTPSDQSGTPAATQEIPPASTAQAQLPDEDTPTAPPPATASNSGQFDLDSPDVQRYEREQEGIVEPHQFRDPGKYMAEGSFTSPIGVELHDARRKFSDGEEADGLLVLEVEKGSPAANAGLHPYKRNGQAAMTGAVVAAFLFFPPAIFALPILDYAHVGESYDMIIGVDGTRVSNYLDFEDRMHDVRPGEIVYLSVLRNGKRQQIKVFLPPTSNVTW